MKRSKINQVIRSLASLSKSMKALGDLTKLEYELEQRMEELKKCSSKLEEKRKILAARELSVIEREEALARVSK